MKGLGKRAIIECCTRRQVNDPLMQSNKSKYICKVCGLIQADPPWGENGKSPNFAICPCCGVEFGYEDSTIESTIKFRNNWLNEGAKWNDLSKKPDNWSFEKQKEKITDNYNG